MTTPACRRIGVLLPRDLPIAQVVPFACRAEQLGFDEVWVVEDLGFRGGIAQAATVLAATSSITVGVGILPAGARQAAFAAMEIATLAQLHPGRTVIGIGHGMPDWMRSLGVWPDSPLTLLREYAVALRTLLKGEPGPADGRYVTASGVVLEELPEIVPPLVFGVRGPRSLALAGEVADGVVLAEPSNPRYIEAALRSVRSGDPMAAPRPLVITYDLAAVADAGSDARATVRPGLAVVGEPDWRPHVEPLAFAAELSALREASADAAEFAARMPDTWIPELALAGTADEVRRGIRARHEAGATTVVMIPSGPGPLGALEDLARAL